MSKKAYLLLFTLLTLHLGILVSIRFTAWPEMFSYPYLFLNKFKLYTDFVYPYPPLLTLLLAGFYKIFGLKILTLKVVSWLFILSSDIFLFLIVKKILKKETPAFLLLVPYLLLQSFLDGNMLWFDNALVLPTVAAVYFLLNWLDKKDSKSLIWTSIFLTAGVFIKQTAAIYFLAFLGVYFWTRKKVVWEEIGKIILIPALSGVVFLIYLIYTGSLNTFWLWSFYYPLTFWSKFPGYSDLELSLQEKTVFALTLTPFLGLLALKGKNLKDKIFLAPLIFLVASVLAIYPRFSYFHLQPLFAMAFISYASIFRHLKRNWYLGLIAGAALFAIYPTRNYSFVKSVRFNDTGDQKVAQMVSGLSASKERVFLLGLFSSVYPFSGTLPPKPWADNFGWYFEIPGWQEAVISGFEQEPPDKIFYKIPERGNWFDLGVYRPQKIVNYMYEHYYRDSEPIGGIELWRRKK